MRRLGVIVAVIVGCSVTTARAQEMYGSSTPAYNEVLKESPKFVSITLQEPVEVTAFTLQTEDGKEIPLDWQPTKENVNEVFAKLSQPLAPGNYRLGWLSIVHQHHHSDGGTIPFTIKP